MIPRVNFLTYNSTALDTLKADWNRNLTKVTECNFISVLEHFKKNKTILTKNVRTSSQNTIHMLCQGTGNRTKIVADLRVA